MSYENKSKELMMMGLLAAFSIFVAASAVVDVPAAFAQDVGHASIIQIQTESNLICTHPDSSCLSESNNIQQGTFTHFVF